MKLSDVAIRRPVFTAMMSLTLVVLGFLGYRRLGTDLYPDVSFPFVTITTVSVLLANTPAMLECHYGVPMTKGVLNPLNTRLDAETIAFMRPPKRAARAAAASFR